MSEAALQLRRRHAGGGGGGHAGGGARSCWRRRRRSPLSTELCDIGTMQHTARQSLIARLWLVALSFWSRLLTELAQFRRGVPHGSLIGFRISNTTNANAPRLSSIDKSTRETIYGICEELGNGAIYRTSCCNPGNVEKFVFTKAETMSHGAHLIGCISEGRGNRSGGSIRSDRFTENADTHGRIYDVYIRTEQL